MVVLWSLEKAVEGQRKMIIGCDGPYEIKASLLDNSMSSHLLLNLNRLYMEMDPEAKRITVQHTNSNLPPFYIYKLKYDFYHLTYELKQVMYTR